LDGSIRLICPDDIRPLAMRLLRRLVNSEMVLFSFYSSAGKDVVRRSRDQMIRKEFGDRLRNNPNLAKFAMYEVAPAAACGRLDLRCKREHRRVLKELLQELWDEQSATRNGWQTLVKRTHPLTGTLTLTKVAPWELEEDDFMQNSGRDFRVIQRLGYKADISSEEASELDAKDPTRHVHLHGASAPSFEMARFHRDTSRNLDPLLSPHFGDEDDIEERARVAERADELVSEATEAIYQGALSELESGSEAVSSFVPPLPPQACGRGGGSAYWAKELGKGVRVQKAQRTPGPRWPHKAPSDEWLEGRKTAQKASQEKEARAALIKADDAEVREHAQSDVPETIVSLLETQLEEGDRKAPKGVVGALAAARLEASRRAKSMSEQLQGLADLERAANAA
jgi:Mor family transcriptional regulator